MKPIPKPPPKAKKPRKRLAARRPARSVKAKAKDKLCMIENTKVKRRSGGRCEAKVQYWFDNDRPYDLPCNAAARDIHHLKGGSWRNHGESIKAEWKLHVCRICHDKISDRVLVPLDPGADASGIVYERRR